MSKITYFNVGAAVDHYSNSAIVAHISAQPRHVMGFLKIMFIFISLVGTSIASDLDDQDVNVNHLIGIWDGGDRASGSIYGEIHIEYHKISWSGGGLGKEGCETGYRIEKDPDGLSFRDIFGKVYIYSREAKFFTYKLILSPKECLAGISSFRLTLPGDSLRYAHFIEYDNQGNDVGYMHFIKRN